MNKIEQTRPDLNILIDYLTVTFPVDEHEELYRSERGVQSKALFANSHFQFIAGLLKIDNLEEFTDKGKIMHYDKMLIYGEHLVFKFNGPVNKNGENTHALELKGEGCREAERRDIDWYTLLQYIHYSGLTISTWHLACDIFTPKYFTIDQLLNKVLRSEYLSWSKKFNHVHSSMSGDTTGTSLYFGSRDDNQINIYDKKSERYYRGYEVDTNFWVRIEIRLKSNKTWDLLRLLINEGMDKFPELYMGVLRGMLEFKYRSRDKRIDRWRTWRPWERFLQDIEPIKLKNQAKLESSLCRKEDWFIRSIGKLFLQFVAAKDNTNFEELFNKVLSENIDKLDGTNLSAINDLREQHELEPFKHLSELKAHLVEQVRLKKIE